MPSGMSWAVAYHRRLAIGLATSVQAEADQKDEIGDEPQPQRRQQHGGQPLRPPMPGAVAAGAQPAHAGQRRAHGFRLAHSLPAAA